MELILSIVALTKGLYTVVASSLIGSILSNLLLVLGEQHSCIAAPSGADIIWKDDAVHQSYSIQSAASALHCTLPDSRSCRWHNLSDFLCRLLLCHWG